MANLTATTTDSAEANDRTNLATLNPFSSVRPSHSEDILMSRSTMYNYATELPSPAHSFRQFAVTITKDSGGEYETNESGREDDLNRKIPLRSINMLCDRPPRAAVGGGQVSTLGLLGK